MRSDVAYGRYSVPGASCSSSCARPSTKLAHTAGEAPKRYSSSHACRRKLRISAKYASFAPPSPGSGQASSGSDQL